MYFNHAFRKTLIPATTGSPVQIDLANTGTTADLTPGQIGLFDAKTYQVITAAPGTGNQPFIIAVGSYQPSDKIGPYHGGYQESDKTKMINPKYVSRFFKTEAVTPQNQIIAIGWDTQTGGGSNNTTFEFECGKTYYLRLDLKGSPALRFLNHQLYHTLDAYTGCCSNDCNTGCTGDLVDPTTVFLTWKDQINQDPFLSQFIQPHVYMKNTATSPVVAKTEVYSEYDESLDPADTAYVPYTDENDIAGVVAGMTLTVAYEDTKFGNCTFTVSDHYELEPLLIYASITDDTGNPCAIYPTANSSTNDMVTELQTPRQAQGVGETILREFILSERYKQQPFHDGKNIDQFRIREIEGNVPLTVVDRDGLYDKVCILHNVPRLNNPTGVFDNDQYLVEFAVPTGTDTDDFTNLIQDFLDLAGNGVTLETF